MKILLVVEDDPIRQSIALGLENAFSELDLIECSSDKQAVMLLKSDPYFELIITDYKEANDSPSSLFTYYHQKQFTIPFIFHSSIGLDDMPFLKGIQNESIFHLKKDTPIKSYFLHLPFLKKSTSINRNEQEYNRVRIFYFWRFSKTLCDIYLKLSDQKYVKIINKDDYYGPDILERYSEKKETFLYIRNTDFQNFSVGLAQTPFLAFDKNLSTQEKLRQTTRVVQQMVKSIGLSENAIVIAKKNIYQAMEEVKNIKRFSSLMENLINKMNYLSDHTLLLSYICCALCDALNWDARRSQQKLCFAALFHDISLTNPDLAAITNKQKKHKLSDFTLKEEEAYLSHPIESAQIIKSMAEAYPQVDTIILQHHETQNGDGFPTGLNHTRLGTLSSLFIVAHDFVSQLYEHEFDNDKYPEILNKLRKTYTLGHFQKVVEVFERTFLALSKTS